MQISVRNSSNFH